jgi:hypothetical protein
MVYVQGILREVGSGVWGLGVSDSAHLNMKVERTNVEIECKDFPVCRMMQIQNNRIIASKNRCIHSFL